MSQESQVPNWDNFTPEQKRLYQDWIKSLEEAKAASIELIKSFNSEEKITSKATNTLSDAESPRSLSLNSLEINEKNIPERLDEFYDEIKLKMCKIFCYSKPNRQECLQNCNKSS